MNTGWYECEGEGPLIQNKRIALNIVATHRRLLCGLVFSLFAGYWVLMARDKDDYGLMGLFGGLVSFISFLVWFLESAVWCCYAVSRISMGGCCVHRDGCVVRSTGEEERGAGLMEREERRRAEANSGGWREIRCRLKV